MFKERDFFGSGADLPKRSESSKSINGPKENTSNVGVSVRNSPFEESVGVDRIDIANSFFLEALASMLLTFASVYVPSASTDFLQQYVSSLTRIAIFVALKDRRFFPPDGTPLITIILCVSGVYTNKRGETAWADFWMRIFGQFVGALLVVFIPVWSSRDLFKMGILTYDVTYVDIASAGAVSVGRLPVGFLLFSEILGTFIECVVTSFAFMSLMRVRDSDGMHRGFASRSDSIPPGNTDLVSAAFCIGLIHYSLERVCRANVNPYANFAHLVASSWDVNFLIGIGGQCLGLIMASVYCHFLGPLPWALKNMVA